MISQLRKEDLLRSFNDLIRRRNSNFFVWLSSKPKSKLYKDFTRPCRWSIFKQVDPHSPMTCANLPPMPCVWLGFDDWDWKTCSQNLNRVLFFSGIKQYDWMLQVRWQLLTNRSALFQYRVVTLYQVASEWDYMCYQRREVWLRIARFRFLDIILVQVQRVRSFLF